MANLTPCKTCGKEVATSAKVCPHCGQKLKMGTVLKITLWFFGIVFGLGFIGAVMDSGKSQQNEQARTSASADPNNAQAAPQIGVPFKTNKFEISVSKVGIRKRVGSDMFEQNASEGAAYFIVPFKYTNISSEPIGSFSVPTVKLSVNGTEYDVDVGASSAYATEANLNSKVMSDVNPGISINDANVFEVAKSQLNGELKVLISADDDVEIVLGENDVFAMPL
jgi:hypothetical protein